MAKICSAAQACTGGVHVAEFLDHTPGSAPVGFWNHSRQIKISWYLAKAGSRCVSETVWKARFPNAANQGYSHLSGIEMTSNPSKFRHREFRPLLRSR